MEVNKVTADAVDGLVLEAILPDRLGASFDSRLAFFASRLACLRADLPNLEPAFGSARGDDCVAEGEMGPVWLLLCRGGEVTVKVGSPSGGASGLLWGEAPVDVGVGINPMMEVVVGDPSVSGVGGVEDDGDPPGAGDGGDPPDAEDDGDPPDAGDGCGGLEGGSLSGVLSVMPPPLGGFSLRLRAAWKSCSATGCRGGRRRACAPGCCSP